MPKSAWGKTILLTAFALALSFLNAPRVSAGWGRVLSDAELDGIYAQGLSVVNISFDFQRLSSRFRFSSSTKIKFPEIPNQNSFAQIDFLDGSFSILANPPVTSGQASSPGHSEALPKVIQTSTGAGEGNSNPTSDQPFIPVPSTVLPIVFQATTGAAEEGSNPSGTQSFSSSPHVTVTFGGRGGKIGGGGVLRITANNITVDSVVNIVVERIGTHGLRQSLIRSALSGAP